jgi:hypothetical protein
MINIHECVYDINIEYDKERSCLLYFLVSAIWSGLNQDRMGREEVVAVGGHDGAGEPAGLVSVGIVEAFPFGLLGSDFAAALVRALTYRAEETGGRLELDW